MHETNVIFLYNRAEKDLFAIFPEDKDLSRLLRHDIIQCYASIGQHSSASIGYIRDCVQATKEQYNDLKNELESIGYNLNVIEY